jgi:hypothetical protein
MKVLWIGNAARDMQSGKHHWITKRVAYLLRDMIEIAVSKIYFRDGRHPLDPNLTVVIGRSDADIAAAETVPAQSERPLTQA